ncbi:hypothetical protein E2C01_060554 [Portunus trituberculatus]|uniref:Uncharacterized protein n=1 Tax=Portunus trituberculatus TaxID=210409 RepID=A0A5B7HAT0_PORTR|nr:hypothetical protein [Portunus trituberculatus]
MAAKVTAQRRSLSATPPPRAKIRHCLSSRALTPRTSPSPPRGERGRGAGMGRRGVQVERRKGRGKGGIEGGEGVGGMVL